MQTLTNDRRGSAAIEFALLAPIMVLLIVGLADSVRKTLAVIDTDTAANAGALAAVAHGLDRRRIAAAMPGRIDADIAAFDCRKGASSPDCAALPAGRYVRVSAATEVMSLFGSGALAVVSVAMVRLP